MSDLNISKRFILFVTVTLAACSIVYELLIAQALSLLAANTVVWYSVTVGLYLLGMGLGAFVAGFMRRLSPVRTLITIELLLSVIGMASVAIVNFSHLTFSYLYVWSYDSVGIVLFFLSAFVVTLVIGILTGIELPLLIRIFDEERNSESTSVVLGVDYIGSLVGALIFPLLLLPYFSLISIGFIVSAINLVVAGMLLAQSAARQIGPVMQGCALLTLFAFGGVGASHSSEIQQYFLKRYYYYATEISDDFSTFVEPGADLPRVFRRSSPYQKIDIVKEVTTDFSDHLLDAYSTKLSEKKNFPGKNVLFLNGDFQLNTSFDEIYHEYFTHVPIISTGKVPERVLVLGGGDGLLIKELLKYKEVKSVLHIDLDPTLVNVAKSHPVLMRANNRSLFDERVTTKFEDGYQFVRHSDEKFDAIYVDFPMPADYNLAKLYSREFFSFARQRLKNGAALTFDATGIGALTAPDFYGRQEVDVGYNDWPVYYHTLRAAGVREIVPYITNLEFQNPEAIQSVKELGVDEIIPLEGVALLQAARNSREQQLIKNVITRSISKQLVKEHVVAMQQGFIMLGNEEGMFQSRYRDFGIESHVLNAQRFRRAFMVEFPKPEKVNYDLVNSIFKPAFPTTPLWQPRVSF